MFFLLSALAFAGELVVTTATPVVVKIDGTVVDYIPGTPMVQVSGLTGIHKVEVASMRGDTLQSLNVNIPAVGATNVMYDGRNLVMASGGVDASGTVTAKVGADASGTVSVSVGGAVAAPEPKKEAAPKAMDASAFSALLQAVNDASFSEDKLGVVKTAASSNHFTIAQVGQLVDAVSFSEDKVGMVRICRPKVVDPGNAFQLGSHFSFSEDREAALALFR